MEQLLSKMVFYGVTAAAALIMGFFFFLNLANPATPTERMVQLAAGAVGFGGLALAMWMGQTHGYWIAGAGTSAVSVMMAAIVMVGGMLMFYKGTWQ